MKKPIILLFFIYIILPQLFAQPKSPFSITGTAGISYEGYGLNLTPGNTTTPFYSPRRPWNVVRFNFNPTIKVGKWTIPANFNFSPMQTNFTLPGVPGHQNFWQFLTNPMNSFGIAPKLGSTEILLGTQYIKYSDLSTGDLGIFGGGINLSPGKFRFKMFTGVSQRPVNYVAATFLTPAIVGAYQRNHIMAQLGLEKENKYFVGFNFVKSKDIQSSVMPFPTPYTITPQDNMVVSFVAKTSTTKGWNYNVELGQSFLTRNQFDPPTITPLKDFNPFIGQNTSTLRDNAIIASITKKGKDWELGGKISYYGAGYYTAGYPFMNNDKLDFTANARFNAFKKKMSVTASIGNRFGNWNHTVTGSRTQQIIANINTFTQFNDHFSMNASYNNFGFNAPLGGGYKSVNNELSANPTYNWNTTTMSHLISGTYTWSKYDETISGIPTHNNTHTALLLYVPTFFNKKVSPDFSIMWFKNVNTTLSIELINFSSGLGWEVNKKLNVKGQLQYNINTTNPFTADKNVLATSGFNWKLTNKLIWQYSMTANLFRYGSSLLGSTLTPIYTGIPNYLESTLRTSIQYRF